MDSSTYTVPLSRSRWTIASLLRLTKDPAACAQHLQLQLHRGQHDSQQGVLAGQSAESRPHASWTLISYPKALFRLRLYAWCIEALPLPKDHMHSAACVCLTYELSAHGSMCAVARPGCCAVPYVKLSLHDLRALGYRRRMLSRHMCNCQAAHFFVASMIFSSGSA